MFATGFHSLARTAAGAVVAGLMFIAVATTHAQAATVDEFIANPTAVMAQYPNGGAELISLIRDVATSHPESLSTLTSLLSAGSTDQQSAVGSGLGQAYKITLNTDQAYAAQIAAAVGGSSSDSAKTAYSGATGNVSIASTGGGAAGGGAGGGGGSGGTAGGTGFGGTPSGGSNSGTTGTTGQNPTQTSGNTFTGGGGGVSGTTSTSNSVSPR